MKSVFKRVLQFLEGVIVGFGAIMPGISGGTLCVAFGMYRPLIGIFSSPAENIKKHGKKLLFFVLGVIFGFVGLSKLASLLIDKNSVLVTAVFSGLIIGTFPQLWKEASQKGRSKNSYIGLIFGFAAMLIFLISMKTNGYVSLPQNIFGFFLCGILWGLSFIVPGLSSSTLLLFFGLYQPMLEGIASFDFMVILPLLAGMLVSVLSLSKLIEFIFEKYHSVMSHTIIGIVAATVVMLFPSAFTSSNIIISLVCISLGTLLSYKLTDICDRLKENQ